MSSPVSYDLQGQGGGQVLKSSTAASTSAKVRWIQCLTDCVFANITSSNLADSGSITGVTIPAGVGFGGMFEGVEITSGIAIAYYA